MRVLKAEIWVANRALLGVGILTAAIVVGCGLTGTGRGSSPSTPASIGANLVTDVKAVVGESGFQEFTLRMTLQEVIRGVEAWQRIKKASQFNAPPSPGNEYVLVRFHIEVLDTPLPEAQLNPSYLLFVTAWRDGDGYSSLVQVSTPRPPEPTLNATLYKGDTHEGWGAFEVKRTDRPLIGVGLDNHLIWLRVSGAWWKLYK